MKARKPPPKLQCEGCGSTDWWRCTPGTDARATPFHPQFMVNVVVLPTRSRRSVAWCRACDPWLKKKVSA